LRKDFGPGLSGTPPPTRHSTPTSPRGHRTARAFSPSPLSCPRGSTALGSRAPAALPMHVKVYRRFMHIHIHTSICVHLCTPLHIPLYIPLPMNVEVYIEVCMCTCTFI
jgi:hypothetical protein